MTTRTHRAGLLLAIYNLGMLFIDDLKFVNVAGSKTMQHYGEWLYKNGYTLPNLPGVDKMKDFSDPKLDNFLTLICKGILALRTTEQIESFFGNQLAAQIEKISKYN